MSHSSTQYGVIFQRGEYAAHLVIGNKDNGQTVMFPPLNVPVGDVLGYFESDVEANLFITTKKLEQALKDLAAEKAAHAVTRARARHLFQTLNTFESAI